MPAHLQASRVRPDARLHSWSHKTQSTALRAAVPSHGPSRGLPHRCCWRCRQQTRCAVGRVASPQTTSPHQRSDARATIWHSLPARRLARHQARGPRSAFPLTHVEGCPGVGPVCAPSRPQGKCQSTAAHLAHPPRQKVHKNARPKEARDPPRPPHPSPTETAHPPPRSEGQPRSETAVAGVRGRVGANSTRRAATRLAATAQGREAAVAVASGTPAAIGRQVAPRGEREAIHPSEPRSLP
eukprot:scaffold276730_cov21-Tisochrysis_lutea.AAC.1